jgi:hypothetical protein
VSNNGFIAHFYIKRENYLTQLSGSQQGQHQDLQGINHVFLLSAAYFPRFGTIMAVLVRQQQ